MIGTDQHIKKRNNNAQTRYATVQQTLEYNSGHIA